jgi:hypothetical protein
MVRGIALALGPALAGAALCTGLGVPAGALIGASLAVTAVALSGLGPTVPQAFRDIAFATIGITLGSGVTPDILSDVMRFPVSLAALTATVAAVMVFCSLALTRLFGLNAPTAALAASPGALAYALSLSLSSDKGGPDTPAVMTLQSLRLLLITLFLPPAIALLEPGTGAAAAYVPEPLALPHSVVLIALGAAAGLGFRRLRVPSAFLLAGFAVSGLAHGVGIVEGRPAPLLTFVGFTFAGAVIGERFGRVSRQMLRRLLLAGVTATAIAVIISGLASGAVAALLDLPFGQVWVSFAPGGVEGMSAMALALGYDPVYVATHHVYRMLLLIAVLPLVLRRLSGATPT